MEGEEVSMKQLLNQGAIAIIYLILFLSIVVLVFIPRGMQFFPHEYHVGTDYKYDAGTHFKMVKEFFINLFSGSMGENMYDNPVIDDVYLYFVKRSFPVIIGSFLVTIFFGTLIGTLQFINRNNLVGKLFSSFTWFIQAIPDFFLYIMFQIMLFQFFRWGFPTFSVYMYEGIHSYLLAIFVISVFPSAYLAMVIIPFLWVEADKRYIQTAYSKGIHPVIILLKHQWMNITGKVSSNLHTLMLIIIGNLLIFEYLFYMRGAAMRSYLAMGFHDADITGSYRSIVSDNYFEPYVVIWLFTCFLIVIYLTHAIQTMLSNYYQRKVS